MKVDKSKWRHTELKSLLKECSVKNKSLELSNVYSVTNSQGFIPASDYFDNTVQSSNLSTYKIVKRGMFAYNPSRINVGSIAHLDSVEKVIVSPLYVIFSITGDLNPNYLLRFLKSDIGLSIIRSKTSGSVRSSLRFKDLASITLPLPSLAEQEAIAAELDALQEVIDGYREQIADLDSLAKSIFLDSFGDPISNPKGWEKVKLKTLCSKITDGTHLSPKWADNGIPFIFVSNVRDYTISYNTKKFISEDTYNELWKSTPVEMGDIIYTSVGSYGNPAIVKEDKKFMFQRHIALLKPYHDIINNQYFVYFLTSPSGKKQADDKVIGAAQKTLNLKAIKDFDVLLPPLELQQQFASQVEAIEAQKDLLRQQLADAEMLMAERMQYYFS